MMPPEFFLVVFLTGLLGVLWAWGRAMYSTHRLLMFLRAQHHTLWQSITTVFGIETSGNPLALLQFTFSRQPCGDKELEKRREATRNSMIIAFLSVISFFIMFFVVIFTVASRNWWKFLERILTLFCTVVNG
jgi:hypothetical protein